MEKKKKDVMWRQWVDATVCFVLACFHFLCFAYAMAMVGSKMVADLGSDEPKGPFYRLKGTLILISCPLTILFSCSLRIVAMMSILNFKIATILSTLNVKPAELNFDPVFNVEDTIYIYERHFFGTEFQKELVREFTNWSLLLCASVHAVAFGLEHFFNIVEAFELFSLALMVMCSLFLSIIFCSSFVMNTKIALRFREDKQSGEDGLLIV